MQLHYVPFDFGCAWIFSDTILEIYFSCYKVIWTATAENYMYMNIIFSHS